MLAQNLDSFFALQGELPQASAHAQEPDALLALLPPVNIEIRGKRLTDLLRSVYKALEPEEHVDDEQEQPDE